MAQKTDAQLKTELANGNTLTQTEFADLVDSKINTDKIIDDLTSGGITNVLSAEQGKELKNQIDSLTADDISTISTGQTVQDEITTLSKASSMTVYTTGSGTYTVPAGVKKLIVKLQGAGGGGGGGGVKGSGTDGTDGGDTTFGTLTAGGGKKGVAHGTGGAGGTCTGLVTGFNIVGAKGETYRYYSAGNLNIGGSGGFGGGTHIGPPSGGGGSGGAGNNGVANSGAGGGGGGATSSGASAMASGGGGGGGGYMENYIDTPAASYSYSVGSKGTKGNAGTAGAAGGDGADGIIIIYEFY